MNLRDTIPTQAEIEEFLGAEFFPKYPLPLPLKEAVDMAQLEFEVSDEARAMRVPNGHASAAGGGTVLECLTRFAILRLQEKGYVVRVGQNKFKGTGKRYIKVNQQELGYCLTSFSILQHKPIDEVCEILKTKWDEATVLAARAKWELTTK